MILGFIETAYRPVVDGKIKDEVVFLDAFQEADQYIAQADAADTNLKHLKKIKFLHAMKVTLYMLMLKRLIISIFLQNSWYLFLQH